MSRNNSYEEFVRVWQAADTVGEVAEKMQISKNGVEATAMKLRKAGVGLKTMRKNPIRPEIDAEMVAALNKLIEVK
jgi:hypothetical protein